VFDLAAETHVAHQPADQIAGAPMHIPSLEQFGTAGQMMMHRNFPAARRQQLQLFLEFAPHLCLIRRAGQIVAEQGVDIHLAHAEFVNFLDLPVFGDLVAQHEIRFDAPAAIDVMHEHANAQFGYGDLLDHRSADERLRTEPKWTAPRTKPEVSPVGTAPAGSDHSIRNRR